MFSVHRVRRFLGYLDLLQMVDATQTNHIIHYIGALTKDLLQLDFENKIVVIIYFQVTEF